MSEVSLAEIVATLEQVEHEIAACEDRGEVPEQSVLDRLRVLDGLERSKVDAVGRVMIRLKASAERCATEALALRERAGRFLRRRERLDHYVLAVMEAAGKQKVEGDLVTITRLDGRERVEIEDPRTFVLTARDHLVRVVPESLEPDKAAVAAALKSGEEVPGAALVVGEPTLRVYT